MEYSKLWLNYKEIKNEGIAQYLHSVYANSNSSIISNAISILTEFAKVSFSTKISKAKDEIDAKIKLMIVNSSKIEVDGFQIISNENEIIISAINDNGLLYGVHHLIKECILTDDISNLNIVKNPSFKFRMLNHWDNIDGSIERGYSGNSFFFIDDKVIINERTRDYAKILSSIGINQIAINNVNVRENAVYFIGEQYINEIKELTDLFFEYGISLYLSVDFAAPVTFNDLETADPLDENVAKWWKDRVKYIYETIPNFGGFLVKADSEGRPGPYFYGRNHADGANMLASALAPYGGKVIWRCFVYNCQQDWRDTSIDRARAAYDNFIDLDGKFSKNVILQIKNGPIDFQVREPASPLFGGMKNTNQILEFQIAGEYTGQQIDVCYLISMFKEVLDFKTYCEKENDTVSDIVSGKTYPMTDCGVCAVTNTGNDYNWTGNDLAAANLYGYGRLVFDKDLSADEIALDFIKLTFGNDEKIVDNISYILNNSHSIYEKYTAPFGIGFMVTPHTHYGVDVEGYEFSPWGTYHKANHKAIGVDRTAKGTGYTCQYAKENNEIYSNLSTCPENLLLFFHRVNYDYKMRNGETLLQNIYDNHFEGVIGVENMIEKWNELEGLIEEKSFLTVKERFAMQLKNSKNWCDVINTHFYRKTLTCDKHNRKIFD